MGAVSICKGGEAGGMDAHILDTLGSHAQEVERADNGMVNLLHVPP